MKTLSLVLTHIFLACHFGFAQHTITAEEIEINELGVIDNYTPLDTLITDIIIPEKINGITVKSIHSYAFVEKKLTSVILPKTLLIIMYGAFYGNQLKSIIIPKSVRIVKGAAFTTNKLNHFEIEENSALEYIGSGTMQENHDLQFWILPKTLKNKKVAYFENVYNGVIYKLGDTIRPKYDNDLRAVEKKYSESIILPEKKYINIAERMYILDGYSTVQNTLIVNPIIYHSLNENIATISNDTVFLHGLGEVDITANQYASDVYAQSEEVTQHLFVRNITGIEKHPLNEKNVNVYPNPVRTSFTLDMGELIGEGFQFSIYNMGGAIMRGLNLVNTTSKKINISNYPSGMYFVVLTNGKEKIIKKLIKE